jgi:hypothetical protein
MKGALVLPFLLLGSIDPTVGGHVSPDDALSTVVIPEQRIELAFTHRRHVELVGLQCTDCHGKVTESTKAEDYNVPSRDSCLTCHDEAEVPRTWGPKVKGPGNAVAIPPARLRFPHARHVTLEGVTCLTCHAGVPEVDVATRANLPRMETCLSCHDGAKAPGDCRTCHPTGRGGRLQTAFAEGQLVPDDHGPHWLKRHEVRAEAGLAQCAACHAQTDCLSCHDGALPPRFHDADYLALHAQDGWANNPPCASCHRVEKFCADCHFRAQVQPGQPLLPSFDGAFHPPGWTDYPPSRPEHHSYLARKNLAACTACHEPERDCLGCHAWFDGAPSTHGRGWAGSARERRLRRTNVQVCLKCHVEGDPGDPFNRP